MNLKKIIREEIKNLPSFGEEVCMIVDKSGDYILNYQNKPYILTIDQVREAMMDQLYHPPFSSMYRTCHEMNEALNHYKRVNIANPLFTDESVLDLDFNINDFEVVTYYSGLIPYTNNIFESQDDFDWIRDLKPKTSYEDQSYLKDFDFEYVRKQEDIKVGDLIQKGSGHAIYRVEKIEKLSVNSFYDSEVDEKVIYKVRNVVTKKTSSITLYKRIGTSYPSMRPVYKKNHIYKLISNK